MEQISIKDNKLMPVFLISSLFIISLFFSSYTYADNAPSSPGTQLAYFIGFHSYTGGGYAYPGRIYYGPRHHPRRAYWTSWRRVGYACYQKCLINSWNNRVIRCSRRCND